MEKNKTAQDTMRSGAESSPEQEPMLRRDSVSAAYFLALAVFSFYDIFIRSQYFSVLIVAPLFYLFLISAGFALFSRFFDAASELAAFLGAVVRNPRHILRFNEPIANLLEQGKTRRKEKGEFLFGFALGFIFLALAIALYFSILPSERGELFGGIPFVFLLLSFLQIFRSTYPFEARTSPGGRIGLWAERASYAGIAPGMIALFVLLIGSVLFTLLFGKGDIGLEFGRFCIYFMLFLLGIEKLNRLLAGRSGTSGEPLLSLPRKNAKKKWSSIWPSIIAAFILAALVHAPLGMVYENLEGRPLHLLLIGLVYLVLAAAHYVGDDRPMPKENPF